MSLFLSWLRTKDQARTSQQKFLSGPVPEMLQPQNAVLHVHSRLKSQLMKVEEHTKQLEQEVAERTEMIRQNGVISVALKQGLAVISDDIEKSDYDDLAGPVPSWDELLAKAEVNANGG